MTAHCKVSRSLRTAPARPRVRSCCQLPRLAVRFVSNRLFPLFLPRKTFSVSAYFISFVQPPLFFIFFFVLGKQPLTSSSNALPFRVSFNSLARSLSLSLRTCQFLSAHSSYSINLIKKIWHVPEHLPKNPKRPPPPDLSILTIL